MRLFRRRPVGRTEPTSQVLGEYPRVFDASGVTGVEVTTDRRAKWVGVTIAESLLLNDGIIRAEAVPPGTAQARLDGDTLTVTATEGCEEIAVQVPAGTIQDYRVERPAYVPDYALPLHDEPAEALKTREATLPEVRPGGPTPVFAVTLGAAVVAEAV